MKIKRFHPLRCPNMKSINYAVNNFQGENYDQKAPLSQNLLYEFLILSNYLMNKYNYLFKILKSSKLMIEKDSLFSSEEDLKYIEQNCVSLIFFYEEFLIQFARFTYI